MIIALVAGVVAGFIHVFSGPDHLAALGPFSVKSKSKTWLLGLKWGIGHSIGVLLVGVLVIIFKDLIDLDFISSIGEFVVGIALILVGLWGFRSLFKNRIHAHEHKHDDDAHVHFHMHSEKNHDSKNSHAHSHAPFFIGALHGVAGTSHLVGIIPAIVMPSLIETCGYIGGYTIGTISAMMIFTTFLNLLTRKNFKFYRYMFIATSTISILVGLAWILFPVVGLELP